MSRCQGWQGATAHAESPEVMRFSGIAKRIAMERMRTGYDTSSEQAKKRSHPDESLRNASKRRSLTWMTENESHIFIVL